jgi:hypothetical protein
MVFNTIFNNISDISWRSVLLMEEVTRDTEGIGYEKSLSMSICF